MGEKISCNSSRVYVLFSSILEQKEDSFSSDFLTWTITEDDAEPKFTETVMVYVLPSWQG